jgi:hypothetical protein
VLHPAKGDVGRQVSAAGLLAVAVVVGTVAWGAFPTVPELDEAPEVIDAALDVVVGTGWPEAGSPALGIPSEQAAGIRTKSTSEDRRAGYG